MLSIRDRRFALTDGADTASEEGPIAEAVRLLMEMDQIRNRDALADDDGWILARTILLPWKLVDAEGKVLKEIVPPNGALRYHVSEQDPQKAVTKLWMAVERIKKYLAFSYRSPLPFYYYFVRKILLIPQTLEVEAMAYYPVALTASGDKPTDQWFAELRQCYSTTQQLLDRVTPDSYLDRSISLVGAAHSSSDLEDRFLYSWRAIDVLATKDFGAAKANRLSEPSAAQSYIDRHIEDLLKEQPTRITGYTKAVVMLQGRIPSFDETETNLKRLYALRSVLAHGAADVEQFEEIERSLKATMGLARQAVSSCIEQEKLTSR